MLLRFFQIVLLLWRVQGETYASINEVATMTWQLERARIMQSMENEMSMEERMSKEHMYWMQPKNGKPSFQVSCVPRGVMPCAGRQNSLGVPCAVSRTCGD